MDNQWWGDVQQCGVETTCEKWWHSSLLSYNREDKGCKGMFNGFGTARHNVDITLNVLSDARANIEIFAFLMT